MSSATALTDAADEAGGEAIYSSDGLPPLARPKPPKAAGTGISSIIGDDDALDTETPLVDPSKSMALFGRPAWATTSVYERLARLQQEAKALDEVIQGQALDASVSKLAQTLMSKLAVSNEQLEAKEDLSRLIAEAAAKTDDKKAAGEGVVYELYGGSLTDAALEQRLHKLEASMGNSSVGGGSLMSRLAELETKVARMDKKSVEEAATKAKVIRADLEAASKARAKLSTIGAADDNKTISELYTQLQQLEGIGEHLPALVTRLGQLASLHQASAQASNRLSSSEAILLQTQTTLTNMEASVDALEKNLAGNVQKLESNLKVLEERLNKL